MMMDQMKIIFKTIQGLNSGAEIETGVEPNLLPLADCQSVENVEEQLRNSPDLKNQLVRSQFNFGSMSYSNPVLN